MRGIPFEKESFSTTMPVPTGIIANRVLQKAKHVAIFTLHSSPFYCHGGRGIICTSFAYFKHSVIIVVRLLACMLACMHRLACLFYHRNFVFVLELSKMNSWDQLQRKAATRIISTRIFPRIHGYHNYHPFCTASESYCTR